MAKLVPQPAQLHHCRNICKKGLLPASFGTHASNWLLNIYQVLYSDLQVIAGVVLLARPLYRSAWEKQRQPTCIQIEFQSKAQRMNPFGYRSCQHDLHYQFYPNHFQPSSPLSPIYAEGHIGTNSISNIAFQQSKMTEIVPLYGRPDIDLSI